MAEFFTKIVGVTYNNSQLYIPNLNKGEYITSVREYDNRYDKNAIALYDSHGHILGHFSREVASSLAEIIDKKREKLIVRVEDVTGGNGYTYGLNVKVMTVPRK